MWRVRGRERVGKREAIRDKRSGETAHLTLCGRRTKLAREQKSKRVNRFVGAASKGASCRHQYHATKCGRPPLRKGRNWKAKKGAPCQSQVSVGRAVGRAAAARRGRSRRNAVNPHIHPERRGEARQCQTNRQMAI